MFNTESCILRSTCPCCGTLNHTHALQAEWDVYMAGALAQDAFRSLSATDRETVISGLCADCQATFFAEDDEEVDD